MHPHMPQPTGMGFGVAEDDDGPTDFILDDTSRLTSRDVAMARFKRNHELLNIIFDARRIDSLVPPESPYVHMDKAALEARLATIQSETEQLRQVDTAKTAEWRAELAEHEELLHAPPKRLRQQREKEATLAAAEIRGEDGNKDTPAWARGPNKGRILGVGYVRADTPEEVRALLPPSPPSKSPTPSAAPPAPAAQFQSQPPAQQQPQPQPQPQLQAVGAGAGALAGQATHLSQSAPGAGSSGNIKAQSPDVTPIPPVVPKIESGAEEGTVAVKTEGAGAGHASGHVDADADADAEDDADADGDDDVDEDGGDEDGGDEDEGDGKDDDADGDTHDVGGADAHDDAMGASGDFEDFGDLLDNMGGQVQPSEGDAAPGMQLDDVFSTKEPAASASAQSPTGETHIASEAAHAPAVKPSSRQATPPAPAVLASEDTSMQDKDRSPTDDVHSAAMGVAARPPEAAETNDVGAPDAVSAAATEEGGRVDTSAAAAETAAASAESSAVGIDPTTAAATTEPVLGDATDGSAPAAAAAADEDKEADAA